MTMQQPRRYYAVIALVTLALVGLASEAGADEDKVSPDWVIMPVGASSVRVTALASWHFQPQCALPRDGASAILVQEESGASVTLTVHPASGPLELNSLRASLEETLRTYKQFRLTTASLGEVGGIPVVTVAGALLENGTELQAQICVLAASEHLWELSLTFPGSAQIRPDEIIKQLVDSLRIRPDDKQQWAKLDTSQQALLAYQAEQDSQQRDPQAAGPPGGNQSDVVVRDLDSCLQKVAVGTSLDEGNKLVDAGDEFPADSARLIILLQLTDAPNNTEVTVQLFHGDRLLLQRLILLSGSRKFAVTVYPRRSESFQPGEYRCQVKVADQVAWEIPIRIGQ